MSKLDDLTKLVAQGTAEIYASGDQARIARYEALTIEKAMERGESVEDALGLLGALLRIGAGLNEGERANAHSSDKSVALQATERSIEANLAASGKTPEERAMTLGVLKNIGALMAGGGISQSQDNTITAVNVPNVKTTTPDLPDYS